ncbi:tetratricopeptide repeat protein [bacterium]|nr:MAG: tetratricopeptide repeat protein [bacterium]
MVFEKVPVNLDPIKYSLKYRHFNVEETFIHESGKMGLRYAVGYRGTYKYDDIEHTIYAVYAVNGENGIQIVADVTTDLFPTVQEEFLLMLKSMELKTVYDTSMVMKTRFVSAGELAFENYLNNKKDKKAEAQVMGSGDSTYIFFILAKNTKGLGEKLYYLEEFAARNPKLGLDELYFERGMARQHLNMYDSALTDFIRLEHMHPNDPSIYYLKGELYSKIDSFATALTYVNKTLELDKEWYLAHFIKGTCLVELKRYDEAMKALDLAIKYDEKNAQAVFMKGRAYYGKKDYKKAISLWEKVKKMDPRSTDYVNGWIQYAVDFQKNK